LSDDFTNQGNLTLAMSITNFFYVLAAYNNRSFQVSDINEEFNDSEYVISRLFTCAASILLCLIFIFIVEFSALQRSIILCYMVFRTGECFVDVLHGINQKNWRMDYIGLSMIFRGTVMLASFVLLLWLFDLLTAVIGMSATTLLVAVLFDVQKTKKLARYTSYAYKKVLLLLKKCLPLMLVLLVSTVIVPYARLLIERILGTEALGIYATASTPTMVIQVLSSLFFAPLISLLAEALKDANKKSFKTMFFVSFAAITAITVAFTTASHFWGGWVLGILFGREEIIPYAYLMTGASIVAGLTALVWFLNVVFSAIRDMKGILVCVLIGVIICIAGTEIFLTTYDLAGANYIMIISQGAAVICAIVRLFWVIKRKPELFVKQES
jgi:O-antigen/teichoic acid export membrane protein